MESTEEEPLGVRAWGNTGVVIPGLMGKRFNNLFTEEVIKRVEEDGKAILPLVELFANFQVALLESGMDSDSLRKTRQT